MCDHCANFCKKTNFAADKFCDPWCAGELERFAFDKATIEVTYVWKAASLALVIASALRSCCSPRGLLPSRAPAQRRLTRKDLKQHLTSWSL